MNKYKIGIVVLRGQPIHEGHIKCLEEALRISKNVIIFIGSANSPRTIVNPFTYEEREKLLREILDSKSQEIYPLNDYIYDNQKWINQIYAKIPTDVSSEDVVIVGGSKNEWYMKLFPFDNVVPSVISNVDEDVDFFQKLKEPSWLSINARDLRKTYFTAVYDDANKKIDPLVPKETMNFLKEFRSSKWYGYLACSWGAIRDLNNKYGCGPFCTSDILVRKDDHILLIKRKNHPGKDLYALVGGYIERDESFEQAAYRELQEETSLSISYEQFKDCLIDSVIYDNPRRSIVARIITKVHYLDLTGVDCTVKAGDDAKEVFWWHIDKLHEIENLFYDDHISVIQDFLGF